MKKLPKLISIAFLLIIAHIDIALSKMSITRPENYYVPSMPFWDVDGNKKYIDEYEDKTILLVFWATWCGSCIDELRDLDMLKKDFRKLPFDIIAISEDFQGVGVVKELFEKLEIRHLEVFHDKNNELFKAMLVAGLPTAFLVDSDGKVRVVYMGSVHWHEEEIRDTILEVIPGNFAKPKNSYKQEDLNKKISKLGVLKKHNEEKTHENKQEQ